MHAGDGNRPTGKSRGSDDDEVHTNKDTVHLIYIHRNETQSMLIFSWNVAGLTTTVKRVEEYYESLDKYFERHQASIVCLQEHKVPRQILSNRSDPRVLCKRYESFWSCCTDPNKKGFNGVVTYARPGTVVAANATPLGVPHLDQQGRCLLTDHGPFVLFNVYAPCSSVRGGYQLDLKMQFLAALRKAMQHQRKQGKAVVLVGDLNITLSNKDIYRDHRVIYVRDILMEEEDGESAQKVKCRWKRDIQQHWHKIETILATKVAFATQTTNSLTGATYDKFRVAVDVDGRRVFLGGYESTADYALLQYDFTECSHGDPETGEMMVSCEQNAIPVGILIEMFSKLAGVVWDDQIRREIADYALAERCSPTRKWLESLLDEGGMVDCFRHFYPEAEGRFTCWNQNKNCRYSNEGSRIDYILIDKSLLASLERGNVSSLRCCGDVVDELSHEAAVGAVTANGGFRPAGFGGGGMNEATKPILDTQFGEPHTGHIYTPPTFSDHIAVSALLDVVIPQPSVTATAGTSILKAQPHKQQRSIASFFTRGGNSKEKASSTATVEKKTPKVVKATKRIKKTLLDHFEKKR